MKVYCVHDRLTQLKHYWPKLKDAYHHRNLDPEHRDVEIIEYNYQHEVAGLLQKAYERGREDEHRKM